MASILIKKYTGNGRFPTDFLAKPTHSRIWKNLAMGWDICKEGLKWSIGDGSNVSLFYDKWLPNNRTIRDMVVGPLTIHGTKTKVKDILTITGTWDFKDLAFELPATIKNLVESVHVPTSPDAKDKASWSPNPRGTLSTNSVYHHIRDTWDNKDQANSAYNWIWKLQCPNKIKYFLWLCKHGRLPTCYYLNSIGIEVGEACHICNAPETIQHIFIECPIAKIFWNDLGKNTNSNVFIQDQGNN